MKKLAILTSHPIQYYAPVFRLLSERGNLSVKVFYTWGENSLKKYDPGFGQLIEWDIPLLEDYDYEFLENSSKDPGTHHFWGIVNPGLRQRIDAWKPDALLVIGWSFHSHLQAMRHYHRRLPVLFRGDSTLLDERPGWRKTVRRLALRWVYRYVDIALYVGTENKKYFQAHGLKEYQLIFTPHAIDNERFADNDERLYSERARAWRRELGFADEDIVIVFAGKLESKKGVDLLLNTFQQMDLPDTRLLIVGNGNLESCLKNMAGMNKKVIFLPFQNQSKMPLVYRIGDIICLPSRGGGETWGLAINEAMACSRAVLVSDRCGCAADLIDYGQNGYVFKAGDAYDLSGKIRLLLAAGKAGLRQMGMVSGKMIKNWSAGHFADAITTVVQSV